MTAVRSALSASPTVDTSRRTVAQAWLASRGLIALVALLLAVYQGRTLSDMVDQWDVEHFTNLAMNGYLGRPDGTLMAFFPGLPALLRNLIVQGFENSQRIVGVGSSASGLRADYALALEVRDFQLEMNPAPHAQIRLQVRLLDYTSNRVLAAHAFSAEAPAQGSDAAAAFAAFEAALNQLVPQLVDWSLREGEAAHAAKKG